MTRTHSTFHGGSTTRWRMSYHPPHRPSLHPSSTENPIPQPSMFYPRRRKAARAQTATGWLWRLKERRHRHTMKSNKKRSSSIHRLQRRQLGHHRAHARILELSRLPLSTPPLNPLNRRSSHLLPHHQHSELKYHLVQQLPATLPSLRLQEGSFNRKVIRICLYQQVPISCLGIQAKGVLHQRGRYHKMRRMQAVGALLATLLLETDMTV
jgi:hypothetical protein